MKKIIIVAMILFVMISGLTATVCPPTRLVDPNSIDFEYDPNLVNYKLMCVVRTENGEGVVKTVTACDPNDEPMTFLLLNEPEGMLILQGDDPNEAQIVWTDAVKGIYYVDVIVIDHPPAGDQYSKDDRGTIIFKVYPQNLPPILTGCNGDLNADGKMDFEDFAIFAAVWSKDD